MFNNFSLFIVEFFPGIIINNYTSMVLFLFVVLCHIGLIWQYCDENSFNLLSN